MTVRSATLTAAQVPAAKAVPGHWLRPAGWALCLAGAALSWPGGVLALLGAALLMFGSVLALGNRGSAGVTARAEAVTPRMTPDAGRLGAEVMVSTIVPVWSRQMEVTRDSASEGLNNILVVFSAMSDALQTLTQNLSSFDVSAQPGALDQALQRESPALQALTAASQRAFDQRDAMVCELAHCADALTELQQLAKQTREIARHTRLVAFNASIEANRSRAAAEGRGGGNGSQAVATELRAVASRMAEVGERVGKVVQALLDSIRKTHREGQVGDTTSEELRLEIELQARAALAAMLGAMGASLQGSEAVQQASHSLREQLDAVFVHFQFGDRMSQMMSIVANDMSNFAKWVAQNPRASQSDASDWLAALEASYTMDEQRSSHHGNVHVEKSAGVEFF